MATDPMSDEAQKRRLRESSRSVGNTLRRVVPANTALASPVAAVPALAAQYMGAVADRAFAEDEPPQRTVAPTPSAPRQTPRVNLVRPTERSVDTASDREAAGLTRVYRTTDANGNSVYSDQQVTGGRPVETRYYGAQGMRADADFDPNRGDVAFDVNAPGGQDRLFRNAERQMRGLGRQLADSQRIAQNDGMDPVSNPQGLQFTQTENGPRVTTAAERAAAAGGRGRGGGASLGDQIQLLRLQRDMQRDAVADQRAEAQLDLQRQGLARQETADLRRFARENPQAFLREELGTLRGQSPEAVAEYFNTDRGRFTQSALNDTLSQVYGAQGGVGLDTPQNLGDLRQAPWYGAGGLRSFFGDQRYTTAGDQLRSGVTLQELGLNPGDEWLLDYFQQTNKRPEP